MDRVIYRGERKRARRDEVSSVGNLFNSLFAKITLLAISIFLFYNVAHSIKITVQRLDILKRAEMEVDSLRLKNLELDLLLSSMQSKEYLEVQARDRLNFTGEKEYVFVIPDSLLKEKEKDLNRILYGQEEKKEEKGYEVWKDFFFDGV